MIELYECVYGCVLRLCLRVSDGISEYAKCV
jgi:hypothetical protein